MAKKLKNYNVLVKALDNFSLVSLDVNVFNKKGENVFKKIKESAASIFPAAYLSFIEENSEPFTLKSNANKSWDGILKYSTDAKNWIEWDGNEINSSSDGKLYLAGIGNTKITGKGDWYTNPKFILTNEKRIQCLGNIETLLDYETVEADKHPVMAEYCYSYMFRDCTSLTQAPALPATTLAKDCYNYMFSGTSLTQAPELPATTLAEWCYQSMFNGCKSLTKAPELPATTLALGCYSYMFSNTPLTQAPELPVTTLAESCYSGMFSGCASLAIAPDLPATTLAQECYGDMFSRCTSLTKAPELPATTLATWCYRNMFKDCASLAIAPDLPATTLAQDCYRWMFHNDRALTGTIHCPASTASNEYRLDTDTDHLPKNTAIVVYDL